ncbi:NINE protein [Promethearchaeum syntrophicum]|uniref:NINE protein n=1 Tax=Promethearchaeum syntrophicum TaxID=2594042 RepID=A0A5B9DBT6_9ARCH|nr:NINE protein [Candidatus Prometheoarchaeum syntrophicum]QEE16592.1 TM2 domain protein [Candidatus Prometheoarchaeum syntrophicum]
MINTIQKKFHPIARNLTILIIIIQILSISQIIFWFQLKQELTELPILIFTIPFLLHLIFLFISISSLKKNPLDFPKFSLIIFLIALSISLIFSRYGFFETDPDIRLHNLLIIIFIFYIICIIVYLIILFVNLIEKNQLIETFLEDQVEMNINSHKSIDFNNAEKILAINIIKIINRIFEQKRIKIWWINKVYSDSLYDFNSNHSKIFIIIPNVVKYFAEKAKIDEKIKFDDVSSELNLSSYALKKLLQYLRDKSICNLNLSQDNMYIDFGRFVKDQIVDLSIQNLASSSPIPNDNNISNPIYKQKEVQQKSKITAGLFGIFLGDFGIHHFYLGNISKGILMLVFCWTGIPGIIGLIEGIMILGSSDQEFENKYIILSSSANYSQKITNYHNNRSQSSSNSNLINTATIPSSENLNQDKNSRVSPTLSIKNSFCPKCGRKLDGWFEFCPQCGLKLPNN